MKGEESKGLSLLTPSPQGHLKGLFLDRRSLPPSGQPPLDGHSSWLWWLLSALLFSRAGQLRCSNTEEKNLPAKELSINPYNEYSGLISFRIDWFHLAPRDSHESSPTPQVPMQYCSFQHWTSPSPPDKSAAQHRFCFGPAALFFLELLVIALHFSQ